MGDARGGLSGLKLPPTPNTSPPPPVSLQHLNHAITDLLLTGTLETVIVCSDFVCFFFFFTSCYSQGLCFCFKLLFVAMASCLGPG